MRVFKNILIAVALVVLVIVLSIPITAISDRAPGDGEIIARLTLLLIITTALWASIVSSRLEFRKYKTALSNSPVVIFIGHVLCWIVVFPWFLTVRDQIKDGTAELKDEFKGTLRPLTPMPRNVPHRAGETSQAMPERVPPPLPATVPRKPVPVPSPAPSVVKADPNRLEQLQKLADFKAQGVLTEEEFQAEKRRLLG